MSDPTEDLWIKLLMLRGDEIFAFRRWFRSRNALDEDGESEGELA